MTLNEENIKNALGHVIEPDVKKDIVELDLVHNIQIKDGEVSFELHALNAAMHARKRLEDACRFALERHFGKDLKVHIDVKLLSAKERAPEQRKVLPGVKNIIAVASGKGGVGKSTVASNLAAGLALEGHSVGLLDADIYGPSMPLMYDVEKDKPTTREIDGKNYIIPVENYGVKLLSIGFSPTLPKRSCGAAPWPVKP